MGSIETWDKVWILGISGMSCCRSVWNSDIARLEIWVVAFTVQWLGGYQSGF